MFSAAALIAAFASVNGEEKSRSTHDVSWIEQRIQELQPTDKEKRFDEIGWAKDIRAAEKLARENNRPVFLFTHDGRMNIGRC
jgi:hypothetical protein